MAAQLPDFILINGVKMNLFSNPLEQLWPNFNKKRPTFRESLICKRGYIATWEIRNKDLILRTLDGNVIERTWLFWKRLVRYSVQTLFPRAGDRGVKATWFSGKIRIPKGKQILYVHSNYDSRFEKEMVISVEKGAVTKTVVIDNMQQRLEEVE
jgi:hypothetical protein